MTAPTMLPLLPANRECPTEDTLNAASNAAEDGRISGISPWGPDATTVYLNVLSEDMQPRRSDGTRGACGTRPSAGSRTSITDRDALKD